MLDHANGQSISLSIALSQFSFLDRTQDLDLPIYISDISPLSHYDFLSWTEPEICFLFQRTITSNDTSLYSIIIFQPFHLW